MIRASSRRQPGRGREDPLSFWKRLEQRSRSVGVELRKDIVEQQDRLRDTDGAKNTVGGEAKGKCKGTLLAL